MNMAIKMSGAERFNSLCGAKGRRQIARAKENGCHKQGSCGKIFLAAKNE